jgi:hypothetical protein
VHQDAPRRTCNPRPLAGTQAIEYELVDIVLDQAGFAAPRVRPRSRCHSVRVWGKYESRNDRDDRAFEPGPLKVQSWAGSKPISRWGHWHGAGYEPRAAAACRRLALEPNLRLLEASIPALPAASCPIRRPLARC